MSLETRLKRNFKFDKKERHEYIFSSVLISLIVFMFIWRVTDYTIMKGFLDFVLINIFVFISMFIFIGGTKFFAIKKGYDANYSYSLGGLLSGFLISFLSYGYVPFFLPGIITLKVNERLRHGQVFLGENKKDIVSILTSGLLLNIFFGIIFIFLFLITKSKIIYFIALTNALIVLFALLPLPNNIGLHMFYMNKKKYFQFLLIGGIFLVLTQITTIWHFLIATAIFSVIVFYIKKIKEKWNI